MEGRKLEPSMYFDPGLPILISVRFKDISESDLALITNDEHRDRFRNILVSGCSPSIASLTSVRKTRREQGESGIPSHRCKFDPSLAHLFGGSEEGA